jgi:hypothetical protein
MVQGQWLHARCMEWKWRLVGSVDREVAGGRARGASIRALARGVAHGVAAACAARGAEVEAGRQLNGGSRDWDAVRTRAGHSRFEQSVL